MAPEGEGGGNGRVMEEEEGKKKKPGMGKGSGNGGMDRSDGWKAGKMGGRLMDRMAGGTTVRSMLYKMDGHGLAECAAGGVTARTGFLQIQEEQGRRAAQWPP